MLVGAYEIWDSKAEIYTLPQYALSDAVAVRNFELQVRDPGNLYNMCPEDFSLFRCGSFDQKTGEITPEKKTCIAQGHELKGIEI